MQVFHKKMFEHPTLSDETVVNVLARPQQRLALFLHCPIPYQRWSAAPGSPISLPCHMLKFLAAKHRPLL
jgi:hypothetical protein